MMGVKVGQPAGVTADTPAASDCTVVAARAAQTLAWVDGRLGPLDIALDHLTLARCALYAARLHARSPGSEAQDHTEAAVVGLRAAGHQYYLPCGLLTRAWLRHCLGDDPGARADLDEVERIARRGGMRLHLADLHLTRARLFGDRDELAKARVLIEECEYFRRLGELEDAEAALSVNG